MRSSMSMVGNPGASAPARGRSAHGFTLIELMIVVAVVAILAAIAYPNFNDSVRKSRRGQAKADMAEMAQNLERWHTMNNTYVGADAKLPTQSPKEGTARYALKVEGTQAGFTITATPKTGQDKDKCGELKLDQAGRKTPTTEGCWN